MLGMKTWCLLHASLGREESLAVHLTASTPFALPGTNQTKKAFPEQGRDVKGIVAAEDYL